MSQKQNFGLGKVTWLFVGMVFLNGAVKEGRKSKLKKAVGRKSGWSS